MFKFTRRGKKSCKAIFLFLLNHWKCILWYIERSWKKRCSCNWDWFEKIQNVYFIYRRDGTQVLFLRNKGSFIKLYQRNIRSYLICVKLVFLLNINRQQIIQLQLSCDLPTLQKLVQDLAWYGDNNCVRENIGIWREKYDI